MAQSSDALRAKLGALFIQPGGPNPGHDVHFLSCKDVGDIAEPEATYSLIRCHADDGVGWDIKGLTAAPPDGIGFTIDSLVFEQRDWLEKVDCPFALYMLLRRCGKAHLIHNYVRGQALHRVFRQGKTKSSWIRREEDAAAMLGFDLWAYPKPFVSDIEQLTVARMTTAAANELLSVVMNDEVRCLGDCGDELARCQEGMVVGESAVAPAFATVQLTADSAVTWAAAAADAFAAGAGVTAAVRFYVGANTLRYLLSMETPGAAQGMVGYSDDLGATWVTVNLGGAAAGHAAVTGRGMWALDSEHIWLAGVDGYIYFSDDGGETWEAQDEGIVTATDYNCIHFADEYYGVAGAPADVIAITNDGGATWAVASATGGGGDILCAWRFSKSSLLVGTDDGEFYYSNDEGVTWAQLTGFPGSGVGTISDVVFVNDAQGFALHNTAAPVGTILYTFTGGRHWVALDTPTNTGLNKISACDGSHAVAVGDVEGGTSVILRVTPAP